MNGFKEKFLAGAFVVGIVMIAGALRELEYLRHWGRLRTIAQLHGEQAATNTVHALVAVVVVGCVLLLAGLAYGLFVGLRLDQGKRMVVSQQHVVAKYIFDEMGERLSDPLQIALSNHPKYCVLLESSSGQKAEYQCSPETYRDCGEGTWGDAEVKGQWLGRFVPLKSFSHSP